MREIVSPLDGIRSPFGFSGLGRDAYAVLDFKPALVADFGAEYYRTSGAATTFDDAVTFARASSATMVDSSGTLVLVGPNVPRRGHHIWNGTAWVKAGLLVEPTAATNLVTWSDDLTNAVWTKTNLTAPSADTLTASAGTATKTAVFTTAADASGRTVSFEAKEGTHRYLQLYFDADVNPFVTFDLRDGSVSNIGTTVTATSSPGTDGFFRYAVTTTSTTATNVSFALVDVGSVRRAVTSSTGSVQLRRIQSVIGQVPSSFIPTAGATATRAAETLTAAAADLPYSATAMSIQMDGWMTYADTDSTTDFVFMSWLKDASNLIDQRLATNSTRLGSLYVLQAASGTLDTVIESAPGSYSPGINVPFNIASRHGSTFLNGAVDGVALTANLTPTALPDLSATNLRLAYSGSPMIISKFRMWAADLGDTGIATATGAAPVITGVPTIGVS